MKKKMNDLSVEVNGGEIHLVQPNYPEGDTVVVLHPDQVEVVTKWLEEAKSSAQKVDGSSEENAELMTLVLRFVSGFREVFDYDWEFTKLNLNDDSQAMYILPDATFTSPGIDDESNNWGCRGALLSQYRALLSKLEELNIAIPRG